MRYLRHRFVLFVAIALFAPSAPGLSAEVVTDQLGRQVDLPEDPQRVVSLAPNITEIVFSLGQGYRLKGATQFSDYPPIARKLPRVGSYVHLDLEKIVALQPDLCIAIKDGNPKAVADKLEALDIPVYAVDPRGLDAVMDTVLEIGRILNADVRANAVVADMRSRIRQVEAKLGSTSHRPGVFFQIGISPIVSVGTQTFIHELIVRAGGKNLAEGPRSYPTYNREQIIALAPEVIIISSMAGADLFEKAKHEWNQWPAIPAVRDSRIFLVDSGLFDRPTPRLVDALESLVRIIHPELFGEVR